MNTSDKVRVVNSVTGGVASVPRWLAEHPVFGKVLEPLDSHKGSDLPLSQTPEEYTETHPAKLPDFDEEPLYEIEEEL